MFPFRSIAATALLTCIGLPAFAQGQLNVICSVPAEWCNLAAAEFEKETGIKIVMTLKGPRQALAQIAEQSPSPRLDVWFGGTDNTHLHAAKLGIIDEYRSPMLVQLQPWAQQTAEQAKFRTVGLYLRVLGIGYNTELVAKKKIAAPACWKDLFKPEFAGQAQMPDPKASAATYTAVAVLVQLFGEDQAFKYLKSMYVNTPRRPPANAEPTKGAKKGKAAAGADKAMASAGKGAPGAGKAASTGDPAMARVGFIDDVVTEAEAGAPLKAVAPCEGTANDVGALSIVKGARNLDSAKKFVDWALGAKAQALGAKAKQFQYPANTSVPASPLVPKYADIKFINYDSAKYDKSEERKRLIERWEQEFGPIVR